MSEAGAEEKWFGSATLKQTHFFPPVPLLPGLGVGVKYQGQYLFSRQVVRQVNLRAFTGAVKIVLYQLIKISCLGVQKIQAAAPLQHAPA